MYELPSAMDPLMPSYGRSELDELAAELLRRASALGSCLPASTRRELVELLRQMNSYYSNLIEGHNTHPLDIERALKADLASDPARRALQLESAAHVEVQRLIERRLAEDPKLPLYSAEFLCWVHGEFYRRVPESFRFVKDGSGTEHPFEPGQLRDRDVQIGLHVPPANATVPRFLQRFRDVYEQQALGPLERIIAVAASHHRLAWIHPFLDGNGRVTRLFTDACLSRLRVDGHGLWTMSRGLARHRSRYIEALARADLPRQGDLDGRGNLSDRALSDFCRFFLQTAIDQVDFMSGLLDLESVRHRIYGYVDRRAAAGEIRPQARHVLWHLFIEGEVARGEIARISGMPERTARLLIKELIQQDLVRSDSPKGVLRLGMPMHVVGYFFPRLFPEGVELDMTSP